MIAQVWKMEIETEFKCAEFIYKTSVVLLNIQI